MNRSQVIQQMCLAYGPKATPSAMSRALDVAEEALDVKELCNYIREAAGDENCIIPISTLNAFNDSEAHKQRQRAIRAEAELKRLPRKALEQAAGYWLSEFRDKAIDDQQWLKDVNAALESFLEASLEALKPQ